MIECTVERELLPMARAFGLAVTPWGVIGGGVLGGRYDTAADPMAVADSRRAARNATRITERNLQIARKAREIAQAIGRSPAQVALNWCLSRPNVIVIPKTNSVARTVENCAASGWSLTAAQVAALEQAFPL
ncbi:MAG: aldo/keto reductase [SAR324 cluster bacterium]|nr:aldo/keto reductase [SAR324 cluster bacterium]